MVMSGTPQLVESYPQSFNDGHFWHWLPGRLLFVRPYGHSLDSPPGGFVARLKITIFSASGELLPVVSREITEADLSGFVYGDLSTYMYAWNLVVIGETLVLLGNSADFATKTHQAYAVDLSDDSLPITRLTFTDPTDVNGSFSLGPRDNSSCYAFYQTATRSGTPPYYSYSYDGKAAIFTLTGSTLTVGSEISLGTDYYFGMWQGDEGFALGYSNTGQLVRDTGGALSAVGPPIPVPGVIYPVGEHRWLLLNYDAAAVQPFYYTVLYDYSAALVNTSTGVAVVGPAAQFFTDPTALVFVDSYGNENPGGEWIPLNGGVAGDGTSAYLACFESLPTDSDWQHDTGQMVLRRFDITGAKPALVSAEVFPASPAIGWNASNPASGAASSAGGLVISFVHSDIGSTTLDAYVYFQANNLTGALGDTRVYFRS